MKKNREDGNLQISGNAIVNGVIWQQLLLYFFPLLFGTFFQQLYNTVDAVIVGRFVSKQALAAVGGSSATIVNLYVGFFIGVASGATVIIAQFYGARRTEEVGRAVHTAIAMDWRGSFHDHWFSDSTMGDHSDADTGRYRCGISIVSENIFLWDDSESAL